jgi:hypothetical protein
MEGSRLDVRMHAEEPPHVTAVPPVNKMPPPWEAQRCLLVGGKANGPGV